MTTRMVHPLHGATHAYDNSEIERLKATGWAVEVVIPPNATRPAYCIDDADDGAGGVLQRKKPGPKPKAK